METNNQIFLPLEHIYIHFPFCLRKCDYCSFYSERYTPLKAKGYIDFLLKEISLYKKIYSLKPKTVYFGGGTPSLLNKDEIIKVISYFDISQLEEITLEANPQTITNKFAEDIINSGINRISLGAQSFLDKELKILGRLHSKKEIYKAWEILRKSGFSNLSIDLIYGLPFQTKKDLEYSINEALKLSPQHISIYCLSLENNVPLYDLRESIPPDEEVSEFYYYFREKLVSSGYEHYEISNFSKPGYQSQHNLSYWSDKFYLGLGPSASGYIFKKESEINFKRIRYTNEADIDRYIKELENNKITPNQQILSTRDHEKEFIFLNLRKAEGLQLKLFQQKFKVDFLDKYKKILDKYEKLKLLTISNEKVNLTPQAYFISNEIFGEFI